MRELNKEITEEVVEYYKVYKTILNEKKNRTDHIRDMKNDFMATHFDEEDYESEDLKRIKKEITKYFNTIEETGSGAEPVLAVKTVREEHLGFREDVYKALMEVFKQIVKNKNEKEALDDKLEKDVLLPLVKVMGLPIDNIKGILKLSYDIEAGKSNIMMDIVDDYRTLISWVDRK